MPVNPPDRSLAASTAASPTSASVCVAARVHRRRKPGLELLPGHRRGDLELVDVAHGLRLRQPVRAQADDPQAVRRELVREVARHRLLGRLRRAVAAVERRAGAGGERADGHDHAGAGRDHAPSGRTRREEVRPRVAGDRRGEALDVDVEQRRAEHVRVAQPDRVEGDVDAPDAVQVALDRRFVERVDLGVGGGEHFRAVGLERAGHGGADRAACAVDDGDLVLEEHVHGDADTAGTTDWAPRRCPTPP